MDERCRSTHAKLLAGKCPWCGQYITSGEVAKTRERADSSSSAIPSDALTVQQLVDGKGVLSVAVAVSTIRLVALKLSEYHSAGRRHGGLSPSQIVLLEGGLTISSIVDSSFEEDFPPEGSEELRRTQEVADYLAPEQALSSHSADCRADIYSLGCILYFLLTGHSPFPEGTIAERLLKHQKEMPPSILNNRPDAPKMLVHLCEKMMEKSPHNRYQSADELLAALESILEEC